MKLDELLAKHLFIIYHGNKALKNEIQILELNKQLKQWAKEEAFDCIGKAKTKALSLPAISEGFIDGYNQHRSETGAKIIKKFDNNR